MNTVKLIGWIAAASGAAGSAMIAFPSTIVLGFCSFLLSNACWGFVGFKNKIWSLVAMQAFFTITSSVGIYNYV